MRTAKCKFRAKTMSARWLAFETVRAFGAFDLLLHLCVLLCKGGRRHCVGVVQSDPIP